MLTNDEIVQYQKRLAAHRSTLAHYLLQQALLSSAYIPPGVTNGIEETRANIAYLKVVLREIGLAVDDNPDDVAIEIRVAQSEMLDATRASLDPSVDASRFFSGSVMRDLGSAKEISKQFELPIFMVIYDPKHPKKSRLDHSLGYFMEYQTTKDLVSRNFVQALLASDSLGVYQYVPADDPLENCLLVATYRDNIILREGVYANPDEGLKRVRKCIDKWASMKEC